MVVTPNDRAVFYMHGNYEGIELRYYDHSKDQEVTIPLEYPIWMTLEWGAKK